MGGPAPASLKLWHNILGFMLARDGGRLCSKPDSRPLTASTGKGRPVRSEEHTSELQSHVNLVCRVLLEKKNSRPSPYLVRLHASTAAPAPPSERVASVGQLGVR